MKLKEGHGNVIPLMALGYLLMLAPMSWSGALNGSMLAVFNLDEYTQFNDVTGRLDLSGSMLDWARRFFAYRDLQYGYLFSFFSTVITLFYTLLSTLTGGWDITPVTLFTLRELCAMCFVIGCMVLTRIFFGRGYSNRKAILYAILLLVPAGLDLNTLWKPDQAVFLACAIALWWISQSMTEPSGSTRDLLFGTFFFGIAAGLKAYGWFASPLLAFAALRIYGKTLFTAPLNLLKLGGSFLGGFFVGQPLMIWPFTAWEVINRLLLSITRTTIAYDENRIANYLTDADIKHWYFSSFRDYYGHWLFLCLVVVAVLAALIFDKPRRGAYLAVSLWFFPLACYLTTQVVYTGEQRYWLPIWLPMFAGALCASFAALEHLPHNRWRMPAMALIALVPAAQAVAYIRRDAQIWQKQVHREKTAPSINFFDTIWRNWLAKLPKNRPYYSVFRDPYVYFPDRPGLQVRMRWKDTDYRDIDEEPTDFLLLQRKYIQINASGDNLGYKKTSQLMWATHLFYSDVRDAKVKGFRVLYEDQFGLLFVSEVLYDEISKLK